MINLKLNDLMNNVDILIKKAQYNDELELYNDTNIAVKTLVQSFPVNTEQQLIYESFLMKKLMWKMRKIF